MKKKLAAIAFAGASLAMFAGASPAGADHCKVSPSAHAQATAGNTSHDHGDHFGWSTCTDSANAGKDARSIGGTPGGSGEAPGQVKKAS